MTNGYNTPIGVPIGLPSILSLGLPPLINPYPTLNLDFIENPQFDSRITFTRASTATYFNSAGVLTTANNNVARFDYSPSTLAPRGLLIEEQRTNSIRNNTMQGAVVGTIGSGGAPPSNWAFTISTTTGLTREVLAVGTENGVNYVEFRLSGTASGAGSVDFVFETANGIVAATGQTWAGSTFWKLQNGSFTGLSNPILYFYELTSVGGFITSKSINLTFPTSAALNTQRQSGSATLNGGATVAFVRPLIKLDIANGAVIDVTIRIGLPQLEQGAFATSVIPTTTTALTRNADVASMTGTNFSSWYNASEGTFVAETTVAAPRTTDFNVLRVDDGTSSNRAQVGSGSSATLFNGFLVTSGALQGNNTVSVSPLGTKKVAFAFTANNSVTVAAGTAGSTDTTVTVPSGINRLLFGRDDAASYLNGTISRIAYYPTRLPNSTLQALTA